MAIAFKKVTLAPLQAFTASAPNAALVGIIGEKGSGKRALLKVAAGTENPASGSVTAGKNRRYFGPADELTDGPADVLLLDHTLARLDAVEREQAAAELDRRRRQGATILLASHDEPLLRRVCDEIWWLHEGKLMGRGDPATIIANYREHVAVRLRNAGSAAPPPLPPDLHSGDGRAEIVQIETLGANWQPTSVWRSGEPAQIRISVRFNREVPNPVIGLTIRTRIGVEVYGTSTEMEKVILGKRTAGEVVRVTFRFNCDLCPQEYTVTAASYDPDGARHDWLDDAVLISVADSRFTPGVANLRAQVTLG